MNRVSIHKTYTISEATNVLESYCAYQERCHAEVERKLKSMGMIPQAMEKIIVHLIEHNFLNEERFAIAFARGKHRIKKWGKIRITAELKSRDISRRNIETALNELAPSEYHQTLTELATKRWDAISEPNAARKRRKFCDYLLAKGFESQLVYEKLRELEGDN